MKNNDLQKIQPAIIENMEYPLPKQPNKLFQIISGGGDKLGDVGSNLKNRLSDLILGQEVEEPKTIITDEGIQSGINNGGRTGGIASFLNDVTKGTRENMANSFEPQNLLPDKNKGFGYRLGEALGTGARLLDNSLVRGALAYGLSKYNGDYNPLEQGLIALGTNMQNKTNDRLYRNDLARNGVDTSNIRGFIDNNTYANLIRSQQIRDNAEWRKLQNETMQDMRNREFEYRKRQDAIENALRARGIEIQENKANNKVNVSDAEVLSIKDQLRNFDDVFEKVNNPYRFRVFGKTSEKLNTYSPEESNFVSQANLLFNQISRNLGGEKGVLSDQDIERIKAGMPKLEDTLEQKRAKMSAIYSLLEIKLKAKGIPFENPYDIYGKKVKNQDKSNLNIDANTQSKYPEGQTATNPQTGQKMIFRGGQWQMI